jgi:hypothetical protein
VRARGEESEATGVAWVSKENTLMRRGRKDAVGGDKSAQNRRGLTERDVVCFEKRDEFFITPGKKGTISLL